MDRLEAPALGDQLGGEPVEQLGVRRPAAVEAEVARRLDQARAEVGLPEPVDDHAGEQRIARSVIQAASRLRRRVRERWRQ